MFAVPAEQGKAVSTVGVWDIPSCSESGIRHTRAQEEETTHLRSCTWPINGLYGGKASNGLFPNEVI
jgi:hypothetical protein